MRYGMAIDLARCVGCGGCATACKMSNNLPNKVWWNTIRSEGPDLVSVGKFPNVTKNVFPVNCQHCENPACVKACPVGATYKREDGIVMQDYDKCIGCRMCMVACPYNARMFNWKKPEHYVDHAVGESDAPVHQSNVVEKCTFCVNRLSRGEGPACMQICPMRARFWGDLDDPNSGVSKAIQGRQYTKLLEQLGTAPKVYYLK